MSESLEPRARPRFRLPATVVALSVASFFNDFGSEMSFPLLPLFLVSLGASPTYLGILEGVADATASLFKVIAGYLADRLERSKPLVMFGYGLPCGVRPLLALATAPFHVFGIRVIDRVGKGLRTAPRDSLIAASVPGEEAGRAFGFHRAMDHAGSVFGPLCAAAMLAMGCSFRQVFLAALVPSLVSLVAVGAVREGARTPVRSAEETPVATPGRQTRAFRSYLWIIVLFSLANSSDAFLLLRAREIGVSDTSVPLLWTVLNVSRMVCTFYGGRLADRFPRAGLVATGWFVFALCYLGLSFADEAWHLWALFVVYGLHTGICEPAERALVRDLAAESIRGRAFGLFHGVVGACAIPAGLTTGWLWEAFGAPTAFTVSAALAVIAAISLLLWERSR
ncbi:MAG TPA: MFS transporter [Planctomycetota bacterium]|nr:MFS transporter [Planctomycetota bacterium]